MVKIFFTLFAFIITSTPFAYASDRWQNVETSYKKAIQQFDSDSEYEFKYEVKSDEGSNIAPDVHPSQFQFGYVWGKKKTEAKPNLNLNEIRDLRLASAVERVTQGLGVDANSVFTSKQLREKQEAFNTKLYHALNASISQVGYYLRQAENDDSLEWTQQHRYCFRKDGVRYPIEGNRLYSIVQLNGIPALVFCANSQMYEIERQWACLEFAYLWDVLVFWKKSIFPSGNVQSYSSLDAHALQGQISALLNAHRKKLKEIPIDKENANIDHYPLAIIDMLGDIEKALPIETQHFLALGAKKKRSDIDSKIKNNKEAIETKKKKYNNALEIFTSYYNMVDGHIVDLASNPAKAVSSLPFVRNFKKVYKQFQDYRFPGDRGHMKFFHAPLNFEKLMPGITNLTRDLNISSQAESGPSSPIGEQVMTPDVAIEEKSDSPIEDKIEDEAVICDQAYWEAEHQRHQDRKKAALAAAVSGVPQGQANAYEEEVKEFLRDKIYHYTAMKVSKFKKELKALKFNIVQNRSGKGSVYYVSPTADNPLFGADENYAGAYFNVHLPHDDGDIIPPPYFTYIKSGFLNIFGLGRDS